MALTENLTLFRWHVDHLDPNWFGHLGYDTDTPIFDQLVAERGRP